MVEEGEIVEALIHKTSTPTASWIAVQEPEGETPQAHFPLSACHRTFSRKSRSLVKIVGGFCFWQGASGLHLGQEAGNGEVQRDIVTFCM